MKLGSTQQSLEVVILYKVIGKFDAESAPLVCWGGWTSFRGEAEKRLKEAEEYDRQRTGFRGQHITWRIVESLKKEDEADG